MRESQRTTKNPGEQQIARKRNQIYMQYVFVKNNINICLIVVVIFYLSPWFYTMFSISRFVVVK